jgi:Uma2 family endonuclease
MAAVQETLHELDLMRPRATPLHLALGQVYYADHPLTVEEFYALVDDEDCDAELIDGVIVVRSPVSDEHEALFGWLFTLISGYVHAARLGVVRGSRTAVRLDRYNTRLPDIMFVSARRRRLLGRFDIDAPPDFIAEIVASDSGRRRAIAREAEYGSLGVPEIWRIDIPRQLLTVLRLNNGVYTPVFQGSRGLVRSTKIRGLELKAEWLWRSEDKRPAAIKVVQRLLQRRKRR